VSKNSTITRKLGAVVVASLMVLTAGVATAAPAAATTCSSSLHHKDIRFDLDQFRASATCSHISANRKVRAKLERSGGPDYHSQWFTALNTRYYTNWYTCYAGCTSGYEVGTV
jgi:hypothetical protein